MNLRNLTRCFLWCAILTALLAISTEAQQPTTNVKVPDAATAVSIGEKALAKIYGKQKIDAEKPFRATLSHGIWRIYGTLYCKDVNGNVITDACVGGVAIADIRERDGKVLRTTHEK